MSRSMRAVVASAASASAPASAHGAPSPAAGSSAAASAASEPPPATPQTSFLGGGALVPTTALALSAPSLPSLPSLAADELDPANLVAAELEGLSLRSEAGTAVRAVERGFRAPERWNSWGGGRASLTAAAPAAAPAASAHRSPVGSPVRTGRAAPPTPPAAAPSDRGLKRPPRGQDPTPGSAGAQHHDQTHCA